MLIGRTMSVKFKYICGPGPKTVRNDFMAFTIVRNEGDENNWWCRLCHHIHIKCLWYDTVEADWESYEEHIKRKPEVADAKWDIHGEATDDSFRLQIQ